MGERECPVTADAATLSYTVSRLTGRHRIRIRALVAALRSGRYIQGREHLAMISYEPESGDAILRHCCLGVACVEAKNMGCDLIVTKQPSGAMQTKLHFHNAATPGDSSSLSLPVIVREFYGFHRNNATVDLFLPPALREKYDANVVEDVLVYGAIQLNDEFRMTFDEIAECFEYTYLREDWGAAHA